MKIKAIAIAVADSILSRFPERKRKDLLGIELAMATALSQILFAQR